MTSTSGIVPLVLIAQAFVKPLHAVKKWSKRNRFGTWPQPVYVGKEHKAHFPFDGLPSPVQTQLVAKGLWQTAPLPAQALPAEPERGPAPLTEAEIETLAALYEAKPDTAKERAKRLLTQVRRYHALRGHGVKHKAAAAAVCEEFGSSHGTLCRHLAAVRGQPEQVWLYLLQDRYCGRHGTAPMDAQAWEVLKADFLRIERPNLSVCIARLRRAGKEHGWAIPSNKTLERRIKAIPLAVRTLARYGAKSAEQLYPPQARDRTALHALQAINGDGYKHNLWVRFPDGEIVRAKTWFWRCDYSSKFVGWRTDKTEHTDVIRLSYGDVVDEYGIPDRVLLDNTLAAANKTMSGGVKHRFRFKVKADEPLGVFPLMGSEVHWAKVEHGQSKLVERGFGIGGIGETIDKAPEFAGAWTGASTLDKPDYDGKTRAIDLADLERVIAREVAAMNAKQGRRSPIHAGRSWDDVFNESYAAAPIRRATEAQRRLWLLATEPVRANAKDGSITLDAGRIVRSKWMPTQANRYWAPALNDYAGQKLVARFDPKKLHEGVHVYALDGRYIAYAECHAPAGFADANAGREHNRARNAHVRATKRALIQEKRMDALQAAKFLPGVERTASDLTTPAPRVVRGEFRTPIEQPLPAPVALSAADEARLTEIERELTGLAPRKLKVPNDPAERYAWYVKLSAAERCGAAIPEELKGFVEGYGVTPDCRRLADFFKEFSLDIEEYASGLALESVGPRLVTAS